MSKSTNQVGGLNKPVVDDTDHYFNVYELQIRNIKNAEYDQAHIIYCFKMPKTEINDVTFDRVVIDLDFPNDYSIIPDRKTIPKHEFLNNIINQIFNASCNKTEVLITYHQRKHSWVIETPLINKLTQTDKKLSKKEKNQLLKLIDKNSNVRKEITDLLKAILKL